MKERRSIITTVLIAVGLLVALMLYNASGEDENGEAASEGADAPAQSASPTAAAVPAAESTYDITDGTDEASDFTVIVSSVGAALRSVELHKDQYRQPDLSAEAPDYVPADRTDEGPYEMVGPWDTSLLPFRLEVTELSWPGRTDGGTITRAVRAPSAVEAVVDAPNQVRFAANPSTDDLAVRVGDTITGEGVPADAEVTRVLDEKTIESSKPMTGVKTIALERVGAPLEQYRVDPTFVEVPREEGSTVRTFVWPNPARDDSDVWIQRQWTVTGKYTISLRTQVLNLAATDLEVHYVTELNGWVDPWAEEPGMFSVPVKHWAPACFVDGSLEEELLSDLLDEDEPKMAFPGTVKWLGINSQYFLLAAIFPSEAGMAGVCTLSARGNGVITAAFERTTKETLPGVRAACLPDWYPSGHRSPDVKCSEAMAKLEVDAGHLDENSLNLAMDRYRRGHTVEEAVELKTMLLAYGGARNAGSMEMQVYAGPKDLAILSSTDPTLEESLDFWYFGFLAKPMLWLLKWLNGFVANWALAIVLLTVIIKGLMLPLTQKSYVNMQRMQMVKPEMEVLQKKHGNDKQKLHAEMMNLYKRHNMNPLGGCLPMLFQMPVYIALYRCIYQAVDLYQAPLFGWITDMTQPDPYYILPVALGAFMFLQQAFMPSSPGADATQQKIIKYAMPVMFSVFMLMLPSGLVFYIFISTAISIGQQWLIKRQFAAKAASARSKA